MSKAGLWRIAGAVMALIAAAALLLRFGPAQWDEPPPTAAELRTHWQVAVRWMHAREAEVLADGNPMLWRMVGEAAALSGDAGLAGMARKFRQRYYSREPLDAWVLLVDANARPHSNIPYGYDELPGYMKLFVYGLSCDVGLGASDAVQSEMSLGLCRANAARRVLRQPKCVTHQLVGFMLTQQRGCGDPAMVRQLQDRVVDELSLDFVVRDEHIQRVLTLYWTGAADRVKPVWLNRMLRAQRRDGAWDYDSAYSRWGPHDGGFVPGDFHASAQALLVIALAMPRDAWALPAPAASAATR